VGPKTGEEFEVTIEKGKTISFKTLAVAADLNKQGLREVFFEVNGQLRTVFIQDKAAIKELHLHPKADKKIRGEVGAPMPGSVMELKVKEGQEVTKGTPLVVLSAMKMEMIVQAPVSGVVEKVHVTKDLKLEAQDLIITIK
jgi:pyruvate carboxylase